MLGGTGSDTLRLDSAGVSLDLGAIPDTRIQGIEAIDLGGDGNALALDLLEILNLDDASNELTVLGDNTNAVSGSLPGATEGKTKIGGVASSPSPSAPPSCWSRPASTPAGSTPASSRHHGGPAPGAPAYGNLSQV